MLPLSQPALRHASMALRTLFALGEPKRAKSHSKERLFIRLYVLNMTI